MKLPSFMLAVYIACCLSNLFTFQEHKILHNRDKFLYVITVGLMFGTDNKILVKLLEIIFKNNKQKH